jgi:flagellar biosynthesis protein FliQ
MKGTPNDDAGIALIIAVIVTIIAIALIIGAIVSMNQAAKAGVDVPV